MHVLFSISCFVTGFLLTIIIYLKSHYNHERKNLNLRIGSLLEDINNESVNQKDIIYRNMHDHVNPMLRFVMRNMEMQRHDLLKKNMNPEALEQNIDILITALNDIRSCTHGEIPRTLTELGFICTLEKMLTRASVRDIVTEFFNDTRFTNELPFDKLRELDLYRISSEILENILKHSSCDQLRVTVLTENGALVIGFSHNGNGLTNEQAEAMIRMNKGTGLQSCKARARLLNADLHYSTQHNINLIKLTVPFQWKTQLR